MKKPAPFPYAGIAIEQAIPYKFSLALNTEFSVLRYMQFDTLRANQPNYYWEYLHYMAFIKTSIELSKEVGNFAIMIGYLYNFHLYNSNNYGINGAKAAIRYSIHPIYFELSYSVEFNSEKLNSYDYEPFNSFDIGLGYRFKVFDKKK